MSFIIIVFFDSSRVHILDADIDLYKSRRTPRHVQPQIHNS